MFNYITNPELLHELFYFEEQTGELFWKERTEKWFFGGERPAQGRAQSWNNRYANKPALCFKNKDGYFVGALFSKRVRRHQIIWAMAHKTWPEGQIDHIDGDPQNNRLDNLRLVSPSENSKNRKLTVCNKSGVVGVYFNESHKKWCASISTTPRKRKHLGSFLDKLDAVQARKSAEVLYGYHENHGAVR